MREPNVCSPAQNRTAPVISSSMYDRRALDCTATLPLVNSLTHLAYMTSTSPRIRETLTSDGGLERLVRILASCQNVDRHSIWKWSLAFQCIVNVGVRGTEAIRTRVVKAGTIQVVLAILENYVMSIEQARLERGDMSTGNMATPAAAVGTVTRHLQWPLLSAPPIHSRSAPMPSGRTTNGSSSVSTTVLRRTTFLQRSPRRKRSPASSPSTAHSSLSPIPFLASLARDTVLQREEDILLSLQLLAYLSKYPHLRQLLHTSHHCNIFSVVEKFTHRTHSVAIIYWAGVIMRNACRKDETQGGRRQCAYMHCGKWEQYPHEFAKCRRCRKAKYCSKSCQSRAWSEGHRWWCIERTHHSTTGQPSNSNNIPSDVATSATSQTHPSDPAVPNTTPVPISIDHHHHPSNLQVDAIESANVSSSPPIDSNTNNDRSATGPRLFFLSRRRSRIPEAPRSGSSTEVEADAASYHDHNHTTEMDVD